MVFAHGGTFTMGCPPGYCDDDNGPAHEVRLSPFAIDRAEVSEGAYRRCLADADGRGLTCPARPVETEAEVVSQPDEAPLRWVDFARAEAVCAYQSKRLCSEAEWEYAARGTSGAFYPWGNLPPTCDRATFQEGGVAGCGANRPSNVGVKPLGASGIGALDLSGNVLEWVRDFYLDDIYQSRAGTIPIDPVQTASDGRDAHVVRGGSFRNGIEPLRVFVRSAIGSEIYNDDLGVRCCLSLTEL
jgi:formylglycine-generating enzyme required for sulfatase activity